MRKVLKFPLFEADEMPSGNGEETLIVGMPFNAKILEVRVQFEIPQIWALCDLSRPTEDRRFRIYGTGQPIMRHPGTYRGTFHLKGGSLVAHLFEQ